MMARYGMGVFCQFKARFGFNLHHYGGLDTTSWNNGKYYDGIQLRVLVIEIIDLFMRLTYHHCKHRKCQCLILPNESNNDTLDGFPSMNLNLFVLFFLAFSLFNWHVDRVHIGGQMGLIGLIDIKVSKINFYKNLTSNSIAVSIIKMKRFSFLYLTYQDIQLWMKKLM